MKRVVYCSIRNRYKQNKCWGVINKIDGQKKCFERAGCAVFLRSPNGGNIILPKGRRISKRKWDAISLPKRIDLMYIRFDSVDRSFVRLLRKYKKENPKGRILLEFPTYPFRSEYIQSSGFLFYFQSKYYLYRSKKYLDAIVMVANPLKTIWGKPVLYIRNGVDYERVNIRTPKLDNMKIHMLCVSSFAFWHGCDRLIEGLKNYLDLPEHETIVLHMVGSLQNIRKLGLDKYVEKHHLEQNIIFHDILTGEKLDAVYNMCDLACCALGAHRKGISVSSELKSYEYAAKGVPMLTSSSLDIYNIDTAKYICRFPANEEPINFDKVVRFYHGIYDGKNKPDVAQEIRSCFEKYCSVETCFKEVVQYVTNDKT